MTLLLRRTATLSATLLLLSSGGIAPLFGSALAAESGPSPQNGLPGWYKKKKDDKAREEQERREDELKKQEMPEIGAPVPPGQPNATPQATQLSAPDPGKPEKLSDNLLFKREGLTGSGLLGVGLISQPELNGPALSGGYAMGWWWRPNVVLSGGARAGAIFANTYYFMLVSIGPQLRYFWTRNWVLGAEVAFAYSVGLSRVDASHLPTPPEASALAARRGLFFGAHGGYLFWMKRNLAIGPVLNARIGSQGERSVFEITAGLTFQDGRPNYTGDVTTGWK